MIGVVVETQKCLQIGCFVLEAKQVLRGTFGKCDACKSQYTLKPLLSHNMVHFTNVVIHGVHIKHEHCW